MLAELKAERRLQTGWVTQAELTAQAKGREESFSMVEHFLLCQGCRG